jgi:hypothetical protein
MDIDLLLTEHGEAGLLCNENLVKKAVGVVLDTETGLFTLEFNDMDFIEFNIPVDPEYLSWLDRLQQLHIGAVKEGNISQAYQIPLMFMDDPYRTEAYGRVKQPKNPLMAFEYFVKACKTGQPVHREDLGDDESAGCVLGDATPGALAFAPHLARRHGIERTPKAAPSGPGPSVPGMGLGGSGGGTSSGRSTSHRDPSQDDDE